MQIGIGDTVVTSDGKDAGRIDKLILDPDTRELKTAVLRKGTIFPHDVEVPIGSLREHSAGRFVLDQRADELKELPEFHEATYTALPEMYATPWGYPSTGLLWPAAYPYPAAPYLPADRRASAVGREVEAAHRQQDQENAVVDEGSDVMSRDGHKVGEVERLVVDTASGQPASVVVRRGFIFTDDVTLPGDTIAGVDDGTVYLNVDKDQLDAYQH